MGANMAKITRIKASDSQPKDKAKRQDAEAEEVTRKVTVKAKNSENKKLATKKAVEAKKVEKTKKKAEKAKKERKVPAVLKPLWWLLTPFRALGRYIKESFAEIRQVRWPSRKETWKMTLSVILYVILISAFIMLLDLLFTKVFNAVLKGSNMAVNRYFNDTKAWYAISTYSGYEDKVADSIRQRLDSVEMVGKIFDVIVPKEKQIEIKNGKRRIADKKIFQGYVLVEMILSDETWYIIRNTPGVTGFVGTGTQPTPVSKREIESIKKRMGVEDPKFTVNYEVNEVVSVTDGPFKGFEGTVSDIDNKNGKLKVLISMFGRETAVELDALQVKKIDN